jgi:hypothetical protein
MSVLKPEVIMANYLHTQILLHDQPLQHSTSIIFHTEYAKFALSRISNPLLHGLCGSFIPILHTIT